MKRILKLGDSRYAQSFKHDTAGKFEGFPQREQFLLAHIKDLEFVVYHHGLLTDFASIAKERVALAEFLRGKQFDYLMVDNPLTALTIDDSVNTPIIFDCIDWYDEVYLKEFGIDKRYYLMRYAMLELLERATKVIAQSPVILASLKNWGLKTTDTAVVPNGYDAKLFRSYSSAETDKFRQTIEQQHSISLSGKNVVVYTGRLSPWYDAVKIIANSIQENQVFLVVGDGPLLNELPKRENIILVGAVPLEKVPQYTSLADVLVFPVDSDCSPIVISEYLATGKPIVMPKGRMEWLLKDGETGCLVDNNPYSWRLGISRAIKEKGRISSRNQELAKELSWEVLADKFSKFVSQKVGETR